MKKLTPIPGYESYGATEDGDIWSYEKQSWRKLAFNERGYQIITIKKKNLRVHRLIALTYIPNLENKSEVNHKDGNKANNCVANLEWNTRTENQLHAFKTGLQATGEDSPASKLKQEDIEFIRLNYKSRDSNFGSRVLGRRFGVHHSTIHKIVTGKKWKYN